MAQEIIIDNLYKELEISPSVTNDKDILSAIDDQIKKWQQRVNNPKYKLEAPSHTSALKKLKSDIQKNPAIIKQHAASYAEYVRKEKIRKEKEIREYGSVFVKKGVIAKESLDYLVKKFNQDEQDILNILGAKIKEKRKEKSFDSEDDDIQELDSMEMGKLAPYLKRLDKDNLYDFLCLKQDTTSEKILRRIKEIQVEVEGNANKNDPEISAKKVLNDYSRDFLIDSKKRKRYDKTLLIAAFAQIAEKINVLKASNHYMSYSEYEQFINDAVKQGIPIEKAKFLIHQKAESIDFPIEDEKNNDNADESRHEEIKPNKKTDNNEEKGKKKNTTLIIGLLGIILLGIIVSVYFATREDTSFHKIFFTNKEESSTIDEGQNNPQLSDMTDSETETEDIPVETYDASSFVDAFFYNFTKNKFDGFTNKGTLNDIIEHDLYGETATAQNLEAVVWEEGISFTNEIKLNDVVFVFDKIDVYEYDESHFDKENNTYEKQYHLSAPFQVIQYSFYLTGEASDNYKAIVEAMKTKLSGIYWVNFSDRTNHSIEYSYGESNQFSFLLIYTSTSIELKVYTDKYTYNTTINQIAR